MEINKIDSFQDNKFNISKDYDFNKDGTVDIQDYNYALLSLEDTDPDNDITLPKNELQTIFKDLINEDEKVNPDTQEVTAENVNSLSEELAAKALTDLKNPEEAKDFKELQTIGQNLSKLIKRCTKLLPVLNQQIDAKNKELEDIQEEKDLKEKEYNDRVNEVEYKNTQLSEKFSEVLAQSDVVSAEVKNNSNQIIKNCVAAYKNGEYQGQDLYSVILTKLAGDTPNGMSVLAAKIEETGSLGNEIKSLCSDIETLVADIRDVTARFNTVTADVNTLKANRNSTLDISNRASAEYAKGYQKRLDLRQSMIASYAATGADAQIAQITKFLDNCADIPFADAFAVMAGIGSETGIIFSYGSVQMPTFSYTEGDDEGKAAAEANTAKYNALADKIRSVFGKDSVKSGDGEDEFLNPTESSCFNGCSNSSCTEVPKASSCDPISFSKDGVTNHFIADRDNDGVFDDSSEFLGAQDGWEEMKAYDKDQNGVIEGSELKNLQMVSVDEATGQYTFRSAKDAGIGSIDLSTYQEKGSMDVTGDVLRGEFKINMTDGSVVDGVQTDDTLKNLDIKYSSLFGSEIKDMDGEYEDNVFMEEFIETLDTRQTVSKNQSEFTVTLSSSDRTIAASKQSEKSSARVVSENAQEELKNENAKKEENEKTDKDNQTKKNIKIMDNQ